MVHVRILPLALYSIVSAAAAQAPTLKAHLYRTLTGHSAEMREVVFSPDGQLLVTSSVDRTVSDGGLTRTLTGHTGTVWSVAVSPDGQRIASSGEDKTVKLWRASDGALLETLTGHKLNVWSVDFSPDGQWLASGSFDRTARLWRVDDGTLIRTITGHTEAIVHLAFSPSGQLLATGGDDNTIKLWRAADGVLVKTIPVGNHVYSLAFSPDGRWLASGGRGQSAIATFWKQIAGSRYSPNGKTVRLWRVSDGALQQVLTEQSDDVWSVAFSRDGKWLASGSEDKTVALWRLESRN